MLSVKLDIALKLRVNPDQFRGSCPTYFPMEQHSEMSFEIRALLQHDLDKDAEFLTTVLIDIRRIIQEREGLATRIPLCIKEKGEKDKNQLNQLFSYKGPDKETLRILNCYEGLWTQDPKQFWNTPLLSSSGRLTSAQAQIARYYLHGQDVDA
ncbi:uncharacterized protein PV07_05607 [Cladophialophora immunda]|uniref:Uncharacterized protein n=1 Tax=Cladophialophora immunda TaxID=569365 RepID=A0A0D2CI28_9EURO|nr:uncharacterized protein PV07_05607 [Cladophialophora immunda]KIW29820.1 hypothetical protein PV07_05607 [Cladophialophora immunda]